MNTPSWTPGLLALSLGGLVLSLAMAAAWWRQRQTRNAGWVDVLWAGGLGGLALLHALLGEGWLPRRALVATLAGAWSLRLTHHLYVRVSSEREDGRYAGLREQLGDRVDPWMFVFFQAQAALAVVLSVAFMIPSASTLEGWRFADLAAVLLWCGSFVGESVADRQLRDWRSDPDNSGKTCRAGLWRYSRHPNYFFEWIHWLAYPVLAIGLELGWLVWAAPALMLFLILRVTGIPPAERQSLASRGDDYRRYQETTNAFFPGPPKREAASRSLEAS